MITLSVPPPYSSLLPAGDTIASCDADGVVKVWDVRMVAERNSLSAGQHPLNCVKFDRSGAVLAAASDDGTIKVLLLALECLCFPPVP